MFEGCILGGLLGALLPAVLSTVIGLGPIGDFLFGVAWDLLAGRSLQEALINGVMSSMTGMAIRWLGEATGLIPTHVDAPHYRGTLNGDVRAPHYSTTLRFYNRQRLCSGINCARLLSRTA